MSKQPFDLLHCLLGEDLMSWWLIEVVMTGLLWWLQAEVVWKDWCDGCV